MKVLFPVSILFTSSARTTQSPLAFYMVAVAVSIMDVWASSVSAQDTALWIQKISVKAEQREVVLLVYMDNPTSLVAGLQCDLRYDPSAMSLTDVQRTDRTSTFILAYRIDDRAGRARVVLYRSMTPPMSPKTGPILQIMFYLHQTTGQIPIALEHVVLGDPEAHSIPVHTAGGSIQIRPKNHPPVVVMVPDTSAVIGEPFILHIQASDPDPGDTLRFSDDSPLFDIDRTGTLRWTPNSEHVGDHVITITVSDGVDSVQVYFTLSVHEPPNRPPILHTLPDTFAVEDLPFSIRVLADDPDPEDRLVFSDDTDVFDINATSGEIRFIPRNSDVGRYHIGIYVTDGQQSDSTHFVLTVQNVNDPPWMESSPLTQAIEDQLYRYAVEASDEDGDPLTYALLRRPAGMVIDSRTGLITWTPGNEDVGDHSILFTVSDHDTTIQQAYVLTVQNVNDPPSEFALLSPRPDSLIKGQKVQLTWERSLDPDLDDEVQYIVQYEQEGGVPRRDTVDTPVLPLQGLSDGRFHWIVWAVDRSGTQTPSTSTDWTFRIDTTPPTFVVGVLQHPVLTNYLDIYAVASEEIRFSTLDAHLTVEDSEPLPLTMTPLDKGTSFPVYHADYKLLGEGGLMDIQVRGEDLAGNQGHAQQRFTARRILAKQGGIVSAQNGKLSIRVPPGAFDRDTYFILSTIGNGYAIDPQAPMETRSSFSFPLPPAPRRAVSPVYGLLSTGPMEPAHVQMEIICSEKHLHHLDLYMFEQDTWRPIPSRIHEKTHTLQATVAPFGFYQVQYDPRLPQTFALRSNVPNPFNTSTTIQYELPRFSSIRLDVYDLLGRPVTRLIEGFQPGGVHEAVWDGTDAQGTPVASGVYLYALHTPRQLLSGKMLLIR